MPELLTVKDVAAIMGVTDDTVWGWIKTNKLPAIRFPTGRYRVTREAVNNLLGITTTKDTDKTETKAN